MLQALLALFLGKRGKIPCLPWQENMEAPRGTPCWSGARRKQRATRYLQGWLILCSEAARHWSLPVAQARLLHTWLHGRSGPGMSCTLPLERVLRELLQHQQLLSHFAALRSSFLLRGQLPSHWGIWNQPFTRLCFWNWSWNFINLRFIFPKCSWSTVSQISEIYFLVSNYHGDFFLIFECTPIQPLKDGLFCEGGIVLHFELGFPPWLQLFFFFFFTQSKCYQKPKELTR